MVPERLRLYCTVPVGAADLAAQEIAAFGAAVTHEQRGGVAWQGTLEHAYRACLWSRVASRVLLVVAEFDAATPERLYQGARQVDWSEHLDVGRTLAVDATSTRSAITHTQFAALRIKDAIVDQFRERVGERPSVDPAAPDVRINLYLSRDLATLSVDLSGDSLHRRGYRGPQGAAPLKENLAAAVLLRAGWPALAHCGAVGFVDPMCGSGTLPIEAALIACDAAPGLLRERFGFVGWRGHDLALWQRLRAEAQARRAAANVRELVMAGYDRDPAAVRAARANTARAGVADLVSIAQADLASLPPAPVARGLICANPPYGERLGAVDELAPLYAQLGAVLRERYRGWRAAVLTGHPPLGRELGICAKRTHRLFNGPIECRLLRFDLTPEHFEARRERGRLPPFDADAARARPGAAMFANRLRKNLGSRGAWADAERVSCFRVYDADMPEYAFAIDLYRDAPAAGARRWVYVQEYTPPATVDAAKARARREEAFAVIPAAFGVPAEAVHLRMRRPQKHGQQYGKTAATGELHEVEEAGLRFLVNFTDYLDTGLFLDHRLTRARLRSAAAGKRFLNLFGYTGTASVYAAAGGARATTTLDLSRTYLDWAGRNLALNGFGDRHRHRLIREDALAWLERPADEPYDLVFLDPPTASRSKRMATAFDVQRDHVRLIRGAVRRLAPGGLLVFSTSFRKFRLDRSALEHLDIADITAQTIPQDFARDAKVHQCFEIRARAGR
jgi:23S rRNA (guanine2445-N2)-methyltransferase / 23S rRNA (guanine2069-N7)-methyltransferase